MPKAIRMIPDDAFFAEVYRSAIPVSCIAAIYGTSQAGIYRAGRRFGYGPRHKPQMPPPAPNPRPEGYVEQLLWSRGRWAILCDLAHTYGRTMRQVQADFHRARSHGTTDRAMASPRPLASRTRVDT